MEVIFTGAIPQCPHCKKPTHRQAGMSCTTMMDFTPVYDENGININPDRNKTTTDYECLECEQEYTVTGNQYDGYTYI